MAGKIPSYKERMKWFHQARFGMFVHFGLYSILGRGEWVMLKETIPTEEYAKLAKKFNPVKFDADAWVKAAKDAGAKYMVLTTRHHDGFCLFDSKVSDFKSTNSPFGRDLVAEYVKACRRAGMKVGFYYSLLDWRFPGYFEPEKYKDSAEAMVRQCHDQVRELMTRYGKIDVLWYDGGWPYRYVGSGEKNFGKKTAAEFWRAEELNAMVRSLQPNILINNRSGVPEDLDTPEQHVTASEKGRGWESCMTIGDPHGWGFVRNNPNWKTVPQLIQNLVIAAAGEGNYLLNVGPAPDGAIRTEETERLAAMGKWLKTNGKAIYGSERWTIDSGMLGEWTNKGNYGYLHIFRWPGQEAVVNLVGTKAVSAKLLATDKKVSVRNEYNGRLVISGLPKNPPSPYANVVEVKFTAPPKRLMPKDAAAWLRGEGGQAK